MSDPIKNIRCLIVVLLALVLGAHAGLAAMLAPSRADVPSATEQIAPLLSGMGKHTFEVTTGSQRAQQFFNQGINLAYGFNHAEAGRSFREAARLDPEMAMAYWGQALVLGPNINMPMDAADEPKALELIEKAQALKAKASEREQGYIEALATRYSGKAEERAERDRAYAEAMKKLSQSYPHDLDAATLYAEALMDLRPWNYWTRDGRPYPGTPEAIAVLESVMERNPEHPGANHFYIHLLEPADPPRAEAAADRLRFLVPDAGHLVHMPAHIYLRVGRYADASAANDRAIAADESYLSQCRAQGIYPLGYYPHNIHFLWSSSTMEGRSKVALEAAGKVVEQIPAQAASEMPLLQTFLVIPDYALTRFGHWEEVLQQPAPDEDKPFLAGIRHYARGLAFAALGKLGEAEIELAYLKKIAAEPALAELILFSPNNAADVLAIAVEVLAGDLAAKRQDYPRAISHLERGVRLEDGLAYIEPPDWHYPVRQALGAVLLEAGIAREAETVYWEDLQRNRENGWSLFGLVQALRAQGKTEQAAEVEKRFNKAWERADVQLSASRF
ncbi:hypothetical protein DESUT3_27140 [Desulfuromonas versatilis]|uniref:Tetratricopeptide repeat protein n=1 Tax=Desulfuromonas versatilis TaxID=2802975 RepID=A0ABM8HXW6_9BACT|nr:hypothetical protein [Desulfuromonas versatilis]BCR05645.1 hypothetical protein DESUT3_27140 [Desulfuromonas versatilis]